jgi:AAA+ superfamily predicted ATPase
MKETLHYKLIETAQDEMNLLKPQPTEELNELMKMFAMNLDEAVVFSFVLKFSMERSYVDMEKFESDIIRKGDRNYIKILKDLRGMEKKGIILLNSENRRRRGDAFNPNIQIDDSVFTKVVLGEDVFDSVDFSDVYSVLEWADDAFEKKMMKKLSEDRFHADFETFFDKIDPDMQLKKIAVKYSELERIMIFKACLGKLKGERPEDCNSFISEIYSSLAMVTMNMKKIYEGKMRVFNDKVLELSEPSSGMMFIGNPDFELTPNAYEKIFESRIKTKKQELKTRFTERIKSGHINNKLYFDAGLEKKVATISDALSKERFKEVVKQLRKMNYAPGVVSLLYGYPGTGKTATVHEIARRTKRDILQVDIANINDKWVGESEKRLKEVFNEYRKAKKILTNTPILLFNEADALIGRRINVEQSVDQMRNNMQNIILEELEKFDGIFFATTNLTENMDDAFSRRFLYKIEFTKPSHAVRKKIWESKMSVMPDEWSDQLANYELTGGQIDNIVRKYLIDSILQNAFGLEILSAMCREEAEYKSSGGFRKIGF